MTSILPRLLFFDYRRALEEGVTKGRGGLGSIYVWASGNGGKFQVLLQNFACTDSSIC